MRLAVRRAADRRRPEFLPEATRAEVRGLQSTVGVAITAKT